jgi:signal transduction histidine kinase
MSIKLRLLLSYIAMTFIPVVLFALVAATLGSAFMTDRASSGAGQGAPAWWQLSGQRGELESGIAFTARVDPDRFADSSFVASADKQLNGAQAGLVVMRNDQADYVSPFVASPDLVSQLRELQTGGTRHKWGPGSMTRLDGHFAVSRYDIAFSDGSTGTAYVLSDMNRFLDNARKLFPLLALSLLAVVALTNGALTYFVSRSLVKPLFALKRAAEQIKDGNLEHAVELRRKDEIGELGATFEEMRVRLNESIRLQLQVEENRKELIANITHDLKTPITGIKACLEGIRDGIADTGPKRDSYMRMIAAKTEQMDRLIDELTLFSKLDLNRLPFHMERIELASYMRDYMEELRLDPRAEGIELELLGCDGGPTPVMADRDQLHRVLTNIVDNSLKYMNKEPKRIRMELQAGDAEATVCVRDNGPGIDSAALPHIFDRFYRAEPSRNTATGGSGLGLAIVHQLVAGQGGRVWAESRLGEGTNIYFALPKSGERGEQA